MMFLDDILIKDDFAAAVDELCKPFAEEHGLSEVYQLGMVVPDVQDSAKRLEQKGVRPFFITQGPVTRWTENGKERDFSAKLGLAYYQGKELELLEPGVGSNFYRQHLDPDGKIVVQHLAFLVRNVDEWSEKLTAAGCPLWVRGKIVAGPATVEFAYMDAIKQSGFIIEFISHRFLGIPNRPPQGLFRTLGRIQKITGKRVFNIN